LRGFEQALLSLFLALDAVASPRHGFEALGVDLLAAGDAFSEAAFADAGESAIHHIEQLAVVVALAEEEFLVVGTGGAIGDVLRGLIVGGTAVLLIADNHVAQFLAPGFQSLFERLDFLLIHDCCLGLLLAAKRKSRLTGPPSRLKSNKYGKRGRDWASTGGGECGEPTHFGIGNTRPHGR